MHSDKVSRNVSLFYVFRILNLPYLWLPILYVYLTQIKGFSVVQTTFLLSLQELFMIFLEIPTGVIADKISRKFSVALGYITTVLPFAFMPFVFNYETIILLFFIKAVGKALISGADSSLLYDTLADDNRQSEYKKITTRANAWMMGVAAVAMVSGGYFGQIGHFEWTFYLPIPIQLVAATAAMLMTEPEISRKAKALQESNYLKHIWLSARQVLANKKILLYVLLFGIFEGTAVNMKWYYPTIFENLGFNLIIIGSAMAVLYFGKALLGLLGSNFISQDAKVNVGRWSIAVCLAWVAVSGFNIWPVVVLGLMIAGMGVELLCSSTEEILHDGMASQTRATSMSFINLISSIVATLLLLGWGMAISIGGISLALWSQAIMFGLVALSITLKYWQERSNSGTVGRR